MRIVSGKRIQMERKCKRPKEGMSVVSLRPTRGWSGGKEGAWWWQREQRQAGPGHLGFLKAKSKGKPWEGFKRGRCGGEDKIQVGGKLLDPNFRLPDACLNSPSSFLSKGVLF